VLLRNDPPRATTPAVPHPRMPRMAATVIAVFTVAIATAACGSSATSTAPASSVGAQSTSAQLAAINAQVNKLEQPVESVKVDVPKLTGLPSLKGKKLLIVPALGIVFAPAVSVVAQALKPLGITVQECDGQANPTTMASCMQQAPTIANLAGVMTMGVPVQQTPNAYALLAKDNIPVAAVQQDAGSTKPVLGKLGFVGSTSVLEGGVKAAEDYVISKSKGLADVVALGDNDSLDVVQASNFMVSYLKANCSKCKVLLKEISSASMSDATPFVSSQVLKDPKFNWLVSLNQDVSGEDVAKGLQSAGATRKVEQGGPGVGLLSMQQVAQGSAGFVAAIAGGLNSFNWADAMLRVIAKQPIPANYPEVVRLFDASNIHSIKITPQESTTFDWFGHATYAQQYDKLWGVN
jgi:ribose transport system substrate-binding protein